MINTISVPFWVSAALVSLLIGCTTTAGSKSDTRPPGYAFEDQDNKVVRDSAGACVRTAEAQNATVAECEPKVARAEPVEPAPEPAPAAEPEAAQAEPERVLDRVYLGTDAYFDFNQASLQPDARAKLDKVAARAKDSREPAIEIRGYADPIGSEQYNMDLSQRRADTVRAYLIEQGVPDEAIQVEARGENEPVVRCEGRQGKALIQCLQPDRVSEVIFSALEEIEVH